MPTNPDTLQWGTIQTFLASVQPQYRALQYTTVSCSVLVTAYALYILGRNVVQYKVGGLSCILVCMAGLFGLCLGFQTLQLHWLYKLMLAHDSENQ